jgi:hypothetical protein
MPISTVQRHGARAIECRCDCCHFVIRDPRCAVLIDDVLAVVCPRCDFHMAIDCKEIRRKATKTRRP